MNTLEMKGDGNITTGRLKHPGVTLTDEDLGFGGGLSDEWPGWIRKRTGETREAVRPAIHAAVADRQPFRSFAGAGA